MILNKYKKYIILFFIIIFSFGCSKEKLTSNENLDDGAANNPTGGFVPDVDVISEGSGAIASFEPVDLATFREYAIGHPVDNPTNIQIYVDLKEQETNTYSGRIRISYLDRGRFYPLSDSYLSTGEGRVNVPASQFDGSLDYTYNSWVNNGSRFHAYFADVLGAVVFVVDEFVDLGDGMGYEDLVGGKVYFKNFEISFYPQYDTQCWFITASPSPYKCRTDLFNPTSGGYKYLGKFRGLSRSKAFNL